MPVSGRRLRGVLTTHGQLCRRAVRRTPGNLLGDGGKNPGVAPASVSSLRLESPCHWAYNESRKEGQQANVSLDITRDELTVHRERAFLVSVALPGRPWLSSDPLEELTGLAATAGATIVGGLVQRRQSVIPATYIGKGKLDELQQQVDATDADVVLF